MDILGAVRSAVLLLIYHLRPWLLVWTVLEAGPGVCRSGPLTGSVSGVAGTQVNRPTVGCWACSVALGWHSLCCPELSHLEQSTPPPHLCGPLLLACNRVIIKPLSSKD